ncbi:MAG: LURP-one-related family protein [Candidatus Izemoplasmatales bacterium]|nr:LURP-one-related family protein [Candidatus Izemoplasmatales bacterium]
MKYYINQKVLSFRDTFSIMNANQHQVYEIKGRFFSLRNHLEMIDNRGVIVLTAQKRLFRFLPTYHIYNSRDQEVALVKRKFSFRPKFDLRISYRNYQVDGSLFGHNFGIYDDNSDLVASISKKIISWGDTYEIIVNDEEKIEILLFVVIIIDQVVHERDTSGVSFEIN